MNKVICVQCREYVDYEIKDIEKIRASIPSFENVDFDKIGRVN